MNHLSESAINELLSQIGQGEVKAVGVLYQHYHHLIYAFLRHQVADDAVAEEITHDVFLFVLQKPQSFEGRSSFATWLCAIARNKAADWWRKQPKIEMVTDGEGVEEIIDPNWDFVAQLEALQDEEVLRHCIDKLPTSQREAIFWTFYEYASVEETAQHLGCPAGTVKSRLFNARKRLRDCVTRWMVVFTP